MPLCGALSRRDFYSVTIPAQLPLFTKSLPTDDGRDLGQCAAPLQQSSEEDLLLAESNCKTCFQVEQNLKIY